MNNISFKSGLFRLVVQDDVCILEMDDKQKSINSFTVDALSDLQECLPKILSHADIKGFVIISTKPQCFAAGVDISIFESLTSVDKGKEASKQLHRVFNLLEKSSIPTVAAIHGVCLGGGLELSLACHYRLASQHSSTQLGLPEVQLGILPGGGGTQRLPRLIGLTQALDLILTGKKIDAKKALKIGLVDQCLPANQLRAAAIALCREKYGKLAAPKQKKWDPQKFLLESNPVGRALIRKKSTETILKNTKGHYPAPLKALQAVLEGSALRLEKGLEREAQLFGELVATSESRALVHIFEIMTASKKNPFPSDVQKAAYEKYLAPVVEGSASLGVLGAGLMGSGIATVLNDKSLRTVLVDRDGEGLKKGLKAIGSYFQERFAKKKIKWFERDLKTNRTTPSLHFSSLQNSPLVIEAVFEDLAIKQDVLKKCEAASSDFIFASNTSSIPISHIAKTARHPENIIGMHFFSPVPKMPLVEIITTAQTSAQTTSAVFDLSVKMGKQVLVVKDGPGFFTTRILAFQIAEAMNILSEGGFIEHIDRAMENFGMPVGPLTLLDEVGIDVGDHIIHVLSQPFGERLVVPSEIQNIMTEGRKGRKNKKGFYLYDENGKKGAPDVSIYRNFKTERIYIHDQEIIDRCVFVFLNEAARCLEEGIIRSADDGDLGAVFGLGFPPFLGGPFHYAHSIGKENVKNKLTVLANKYGKRFAPCQYWG